MTLQLLQSKISKLSQEYDHAVRKAEEQENRLVEVQAKMEQQKQAQDILQHVAQAVQKEAHSRLASVVSRCLKAVFGNEYGFRIDFVRARGKTEARLILLKDKLELTDPMNEAGGGVIDVAAFALRLSCMMLSRPRPRKLLILDEPFKHLSQQYRPAVAELIETLAREMEVQLIMVTHDDEFQIGKTISLG